MQKKIIKVLPPKLHTAAQLQKRVAAYARVSSGKDAMLHSLSAQISHYSELIQGTPDWSYVGVYADEAVTGTKAVRPEFQRLLEDCRAGKIDMILTKSISRFARNTVTTLQTVRELRSLNVDVYFEEQNIHTLGGDGEFLLTLLAVYAQEEARSVSDNMKWRIQANYQQGLPWSVTMYGFRQVDGTLEIVPEEAEAIRMAAELYLQGMGGRKIAQALNTAGYRTKYGKEWIGPHITGILFNEKVVGDLLLQKHYINDPLEKKKLLNRGELPSYYVSNSHAPILDHATFERIQQERERRIERYGSSKPPSNPYPFQRRKSTGRWAASAHPFSGKMVCAECGGTYGSKVWHSTSEYRRTVWQCNDRYKGGKCKTPHLTDEQIKLAFLAAFNQQIQNRADIIAAYHEIIDILTDTSGLDAEAGGLQAECAVTMDLSDKLVKENAQMALDQVEYLLRYKALNQRYDAAHARIAEITKEKQERNAKKINIQHCLQSIMSHTDLVTEFDEELWYTTIESVTVSADYQLRFNFRGGSVVAIKLDLWRLRHGRENGCVILPDIEHI